MKIHTTCRHVKLTPALSRFISDRLERLEKFAYVAEAHVVLETQKSRQLAEVLLKTRRKELVAREESHDLKASIESAVARLERQVKKMKDKKKSQKHEKAVVAAVAADGEEDEETESPRERPRLVAGRPHGKPLTVDEATMVLLENGTDFLVFVNADTEQLNVLYRRKDGDLGWIAPRRARA